MPTGRYALSQMVNTQDGYYPVTAITDSDNALGGAGWGWGAGLQLAFGTGSRSFDWLFDAGFRMNWTNKMVRGYFNDYANYNHTVGITRAPIYYNIPLLFGPRFTFPVADGFEIFVAGLVGLDIRIISNATYSANTFVDYNSAGALAFRVAAGFLLFDHLRLEANWSWMGDNVVKATLYDGKYHEMGAYGRLETTQLGLRLGWTF